MGVATSIDGDPFGAHMSDVGAEGATSGAVVASIGVAAYVPTDTTRLRTVFALQRQLLMRARGALFVRLHALGGVPTIDDDAEQEALDMAATRDACLALRDVLAEAFAACMLSPVHREYWAMRAPAVLCFGARLHGELARLVPRQVADPRATQATALFQLAASFLDWIGDEQAEGAEVARLLPAGALPSLACDAPARDDLRHRARDTASGAARAFVTLLVALLDRVAPLLRDPAPFAQLLGAAYDAELASFPGAATSSASVESARRKSELPALVCGELARIGLAARDDAWVQHAAAAIAPVFRIVDDVADLSDDLRTGQLNALAAAFTREGDDVEHTMREVLASDVVERDAAEAADCILRVDALARDAGASAATRRALSQWLRTRTWRWLS